jgi:hypothetical protein
MESSYLCQRHHKARSSGEKPVLTVIFMYQFAWHLMAHESSRRTCNCPLYRTRNVTRTTGGGTCHGCHITKGIHGFRVNSIGLSVPHRKHITSRYESNRLMLSIGLWQWYINITITILDIIHRPDFYLKLNSTL